MESRSRRGIAIPRMLDIEPGRTVLRKIEIVVIGESVPSAQISAEGRRRVVSQKVRRNAGRANVMVSVHGKEQLAAKEGSSGFVRIQITVEDREEEVAVVIFTAYGINVITGIENEIRLRSRWLIRQRNLRSVKDEVSNAGFVIHDASRIRVGNDRKKAFVAFYSEAEDRSALAGAKR